MKKQLLIVLFVVLVIGGLTFFEQVMSIFHGMTPLQALETIVNYILHVVVVTVLGYAVFGLPEIVRPWLQMYRRGMRNKRSALRRRQTVEQHAPRAPRVNKDQVLMWMASQMSGKTKSKTDAHKPADDIQIKL